MNRGELEHIIRAASAIADEPEIVIIGSQAILGSHPDAPAPLTDSMEADVFPRRRPELADAVDGAIGEGSAFQAAFGYYAHGVGPETATLPAGWEERLVPVCNENTRGATGWCLEPHDLAVSKLAAGREKDLMFVETLLRYGLASAEAIRQRLERTSFPDPAQRTLIAQRLERLCS